jgi:DNA polymerase (family 10)
MADLTNAQIAAAFDELGDLYELDGAVSYRVIAYRNAAKAVREASVSVIGLSRQGRVTELPGVGKTLEEKLKALDETGDIPAAQKLRARIPTGLISVMQLPGFGPKRARRLYDELGVDSLESLKTAAEAGQIRGLRGFGAKVEENLKKTLAEQEEGGGPAPRILLSRALPVADQIARALRAHPGVDRVEVAGSLRRLVDSVKDIDIIVTATDPAALAPTLRELELVESVHQEGDAGARVTTHSGMKVDIKVVEPDQFGNVLQHFTGAKAHNVSLREAAVRKGLHVSEYGILDDATGETTRCATEEEVYAKLGLQWIPPELREGRGELEAALPGGELPVLIELEDLKGDLHCHTTLSDGKQTAEEMAAAAIKLGLRYLAITDHSATHGFGDDVSPERLEERIDEIHALNERLDGLELLIGTETNITPDGAPDYPDELLERLDWVIASVHTSFQMDEQAMTERVVAAVEHPWVDAIGHPTGRKIETRQPYSIDMERVIEAAARTGTMIEINASPDRRDMNEIHARAAAAAGVRVLINSDAHSTRNFELRKYGIATARRAWLTAGQVANTLPWAEFRKLRKREASLR